MATLKTIEFLGTSSDVEQKVRARLSVKEGDQVTGQWMAGILAAAKEVDEHFTGGMSMEKDGARVFLSLGTASPNFIAFRDGAPVYRTADGVEGVVTNGGPATGVSGGVQGGVAGGVAGGVVAPREAGSNPQTIRVGGNVQSANLISKVNPVYPPLAKQARIQGVVHLTTTIGADGAVQNIEVMSGHPLLVPAAVEAVKQWVYKPTLLNGAPVAVITQVDVNFTLAADPQ
jgi:TonB family protein